MTKREGIRVLNVGNIANNGFLMSKLLRTQGVLSYSISADYTHIMGYPLWEEKTVELKEKEHFAPSYSKQELELYPWFASGTWKECLIKIRQVALREQGASFFAPESGPTEGNFKKGYEFRSWINRTFFNRLRMLAKKHLTSSMQTFISENIVFTYRRMKERHALKQMEELFDVFIFYGPSTYLIANKKMDGLNIAMEHGTLREYVYQPYRRPRASKSGYTNSDVILVTNQDSLPRAQSMQQDKMEVISVPHPNWDLEFQEMRRSRERRLQEILEKGRVLFPARHTYGTPVDQGKGTEVMMEAIVEIVMKRPQLKISLIRWGNDINKSVRFLADYGISEKVEWLDLQSRPMLRKTMLECLAVVDQMKIPAYGALTADALGLGVPVLTAHSCENDMAFFGSCAPVYGTNSAWGIVEHIEHLASDRVASYKHIATSGEWYDNNLSSRKLLSTMNRLLAMTDKDL